MKKQELNYEHRGPIYQAYRILQFAFVVVPLIAGIDKFMKILSNWNFYLSSPFNVTGDVSKTMMIVGAVEIISAIGIFLKPKYFSYIYAIWLCLIITNLLVLGHYYDVALRDFGLVMGLLALGRLSKLYNPPKS